MIAYWMSSNGMCRQPKSQPKAATAGGKPPRRGRRAARRGRNNPRKKTVEELDAEMVDYFANNENANANAGEGNAAQAQPATNGNDVNMDEISVSGAYPNL